MGSWLRTCTCCTLPVLKEKSCNRFGGQKVRGKKTSMEHGLKVAHCPTISQIKLRLVMFSGFTWVQWVESQLGRNMENLVDLGRVRALGVSNFGIQERIPTGSHRFMSWPQTPGVGGIVVLCSSETSLCAEHLQDLQVPSQWDIGTTHCCWISQLHRNSKNYIPCCFNMLKPDSWIKNIKIGSLYIGKVH